MRLGDRVAAKIGFRINSVIGEVFGVTFDNGIRWKIPVYISGLGIKPESIAFCAPGEHNDIGHPDYYKRLYVDKEKKYGVFDYKAEKVRLEWGDDRFNETGRYEIIYLEKSKTIVKFAERITAKKLNNMITSYVNSDVDGTSLTGILINIFTRDKHKELSGEWYEISFYDDIDLIEGWGDYDINDIRLILHDEVTLSEYELPAVVCGVI